MTEQLCQSCGLCCDGTLFSSVRLESSELAWAERVHLPIIDVAGAPSFRQPCSCFDGSRCVEYADRPGTCRTFVCQLLDRLDDGEVTLEQALAKVARAKELIRDAFPNGVAAGAPPGREDEVRWKQDAAELMARLDRDFHTRT